MMKTKFCVIVSLLIMVCLAQVSLAQTVDLSRTVVVANPDSIAAKVLIEEVAKKTGLTLSLSLTNPQNEPYISLFLLNPSQNSAGLKPEGYSVSSDGKAVNIVAIDSRGLLFGVGEFLQKMESGKGKLAFPANFDVAKSPRYEIRGHQLGYRATANSWDAWTAEQFDQYIRELALLGCNAFEGIPFQDERKEPLMKMTRAENNILFSEICQKYDLDYWVWTPITIDLNDAEKRAADLKMHEEFYKICPKLDAVFFPGGDPGDNPAKLVISFMEDIAVVLAKYHPNAKVWLSNQGYSVEDHLLVYNYLRTESPDWFGGLVNGPSSAPIDIERNMLPTKYKLRLYPDICHNKICQYQVPWWDMAFARTLGREAINPRPVQYATIHNWFAPYSDGFLSYSDGVTDDVNKGVWSQLAFDPDKPLREVLISYCQLFFGSDIAEKAADGIFALEKNWRGALIDNASVEGTLLYWQNLEKQYPELAKNWRYQMCLVRAYYDAYLRRKLIDDTALEDKVNAILTQCDTLGSDRVIDDALKVLAVADEKKAAPELRERIIALYDDLFKSIQLQSSVPKYGACGYERGASLDFIDLPLNNRFWLEDEFAKIQKMSSEKEKCERLMQIARWENPGFGSYYDDIGNPAKSPHVRHSVEIVTKPGEEAYPVPLQWWYHDGFCRYRISHQVTLDYPEAMVYEGLDPEADYIFRVSGLGTLRVMVNGKKIEPLNGEKIAIGGFIDFPIDKELLKERKLEVTFIPPTDEDHLNWRHKSRLAEAWLLKQ